MMRALKKLIKNKLTKIQIFIKKKLRMIRLLMNKLFKIFNRFKKFKAHQVTNKIQISVGKTIKKVLKRERNFKIQKNLLMKVIFQLIKMKIKQRPENKQMNLRMNCLKFWQKNIINQRFNK